MSLPATIGSLKQKLSDLQIGDYIAVKYTATTSGQVGTFSDFGADLATAQANEIPVTGSATPNGYLYLVKVAKGLLVSSIVAQHSISWDTLNASKVIQGLPWDNGNIIPTMTSNTSPSGVASASGVYNGGTYYDAWKAFDKKTGFYDRWVTTGSTGWISYQFDSPKIITQYSLVTYNGPSDYITSMPKDWTFEGSNDGINWTILDKQIGISTWVSGVKKIFPLINKQVYKIYRINVTANNGGDYVQIHEIEMYETAGVIRSLTGGVAYADVNGNKATTDQGYGAWPTNNEWDKYIRSFPIDKIQAGKTLDDVFHINDIASWCQDTPINGTFSNASGQIASSSSSSRVWRGLINNTVSNWKDFSFQISNSSVSVIGFRPVFEYKE